MNEELKQVIKEYLKENLTIENKTTPDIYGNNPDQIVITLKLDGEEIASTKIYPLY